MNSRLTVTTQFSFMRSSLSFHLGKYFAMLLQTSVLLSLMNCNKQPDTLFKLLPSSSTGVDFSNTITETDSFNILTHEYIYNGGGVAVADFNKDGLQDLFFTGNEVPNKLYLNKGDLQFKDVTNEAMVNVSGRWNSGVVVVDINDDGWLDLYVTATMKKDSTLRANMLFLNKGTKEEGFPPLKKWRCSMELQTRAIAQWLLFLTTIVMATLIFMF